MPRISKAEMDRWLASGSWKSLEKKAAKIVSTAEASAGAALPSLLLGGGTRLMLELNHRISRDIDLFIRDPQWIGLLSPRLNDNVGDLVQGYEEDATFLKLKFPEGEIDFIVRMSLTGLSPESSGKSLFLLEPIEEVLAKKLFYRGAYLTPRDLFDWVCIESMNPKDFDARRIARVINTRIEGIRHSLERMESGSSAKRTWELIETPLELDFDKSVVWGKERLEMFRDLFRDEKEKGTLQKEAPEKDRTRPKDPKV